jgi:hypothetical protein
MTEHPAQHRLEEAAIGEADEATRAHVEACEACRAYVAKLAAAARKFDAKALAEKASPVRTLAYGRVAWLLAPIAAAAIYMLLVRPPGPEPSPGERFKGDAPVVAAIVEHEGRQERIAGEVRVRAGDRVRVEVSVDRDRPIAAGVLEDDGAWTQLLAPAELDAGTHFSELAARFEDPLRPARILVGAPDAVARARADGGTDDVVVLRIVPAP